MEHPNQFTCDYGECFLFSPAKMNSPSIQEIQVECFCSFPAACSFPFRRDWIWKPERWKSRNISHPRHRLKYILFPEMFCAGFFTLHPSLFCFLNREKCSFLGKPSGSSLICFHPVFFGQSWELQALPQTEQEMTDGMDRPWGEARLQPITLPFCTLDFRVLCPIPNAPAPLWAVVGWRFPVVSRDRAFPQGGFEHISLNHFLSPPDDLFPWQNSE